MIEPCRQIYPASTTNTITIKWKPVEIIAGSKVAYEIKYKEANVKGKYKKEESEEAEIVLMDLKSNTNYEVIICYTNEMEETIRMFEPFNFGTKQSSHHSLFQANSDIDNTTSPVVYALKVASSSTYYADVKIKNEKQRIPVRACEILSNYHPERHRRSEKSILLLGETGSGKSTLLDAVINYIGEVSFDDNYRLSLINKTEDERKKAVHQYQSQTLGMTCYRIPHLEDTPLNFPLNLIDTPGFADTRGKEFDDTIADQIEVLFLEVIQQIDAICIVVPLSCVRLNKCTEDAYDRILKLFGKDIKGNIFVLITKDDGGAPQCLEALRQAKVPFKQSFRFSNADLFVQSTPEEAKNERERWIKRNKTFKKLFDAIDKVEPRSVEKSEKIVKARRQLKEQLTNMMAQFNDQLKIISVIKENKQRMEKNKEEMLRNKNYVHKELVTSKLLQYTGYNSLLCHTCKKTCQKQCTYRIYAYLCDVMSWNAICTICKCDSKTHEVMGCEYIVETKEVEIKLEAMKTVHDELQGRETVYKEEMEKKQEELEQSFSELATMIGQVSNLLDEINKNALKVEFPSICNCIDHLIELVQADSSNNNREEGITILKKIKTKILQKLPIKDIAFE